MSDIVLATLNAKYIHASFGLRYLMANLGELKSRAALLEFDINQRPLDIAEVLLAQNPRILGLGVYIWNVTETTEVIAAIKRIRPEVIVVLGGPEVSYETDKQEIVRLADHVITGEADLKFAEVCRAILNRDNPLTSSRPTPNPSEEGSGTVGARLSFPSLEGLGVGSGENKLNYWCSKFQKIPQSTFRFFKTLRMSSYFQLRASIQLTMNECIGIYQKNGQRN